VLVNNVLGVAGQNAANAREHPPGTDRTAFLGAVAARRARLAPELYPFVRQIAARRGWRTAGKPAYPPAEPVAE
jgi:hypothetical protein